MRFRVATLILCIALIVYFSYHLVEGNRGLEARTRLESRISALEGQLEGLELVRKRIERDVALMRAERLDPDMLDERARAMLNMAHPNDLVILRPKTLGHVGR